MTGADDQAAERRPWYRNPWLWAFVSGCVTLTLIRPMLRHEPPPPPVSGRLPEFRLIDTEGRPFRKADLEGGVWVFGFFCTRCPESGPQLAALRRLAERYDRVGEETIRIVAVTVDPLHDTPERLREWRGHAGPDPDGPRLLGGDPREVAELLERGFGFPADDRGGGRIPGNEAPLRRTALVLVDGTGGIRGHYTDDEMGLDEIFHRSRHVRGESGAREGGSRLRCAAGHRSPGTLPDETDARRILLECRSSGRIRLPTIAVPDARA